MKSSSEFCTLISSDINNVGITVREIITFLQTECMGINEDVIFDLKVILNEMLLNAIKHGNRQEYSKNVKISVGLCKNTYIYIIIEDEGQGCKVKPFQNQNNISDCDIFNLKETGRGIMIVSNLCDCIKYNDKGNKVVILKKFTDSSLHCR